MVARVPNAMLVGLVLLLITPYQAQAQLGAGQLLPAPLAKLFVFTPALYADQLYLNVDQRIGVQQIERQYKMALRAILAKTAVGIATLDSTPEGEAVPIVAATHEITGGLLEVQRARILFERKALDLMTPDQRVLFFRLTVVVTPYGYPASGAYPAQGAYPPQGVYPPQVPYGYPSQAPSGVPVQQPYPYPGQAPYAYPPPQPTVYPASW